MQYVHSFLLLLTRAAPILVLVFFIWGIIDNYFLTRYVGKLNRGYTIWNQALSEEARQFLSNLKEDTGEINKVGFWRTKTSFIIRKDGEALIRYENPVQRTSWPIVFYINLSLADPKIEYRLSLPMLLSLLPLVILNNFVGLFLLVAFMISSFMEVGGANNFLAKKTELYLIRLFHQNQKDS
jgi:hypothetical protein